MTKKILFIFPHQSAGFKLAIVSSNIFPDSIYYNNGTYKRSPEVGWIHWDFLINDNNKMVGLSIYDSDIDDLVGWTRNVGKVSGNKIKIIFDGVHVKYRIENEQAFGSQVYIFSNGETALALSEWNDEFSTIVDGVTVDVIKLGIK